MRSSRAISILVNLVALAVGILGLLGAARLHSVMPAFSGATFLMLVCFPIALILIAVAGLLIPETFRAHDR